MRGWGGGPRQVRYHVKSALWRAPPIRVAVLTDLHICDPWTPLAALEVLVDQVLAAAPDVILLPGDFLARNVIFGRFVAIEPIAKTLGRLVAPLGVFASLGNHDWKDCPLARVNGYTASGVAPALEAEGVSVLSNRAVRLVNGAWLVGLDSQQGIGRVRAPQARHDMGAAFADLPDGASTLMMAHEPDIFLDHRHPVALQVSGHTHGGQIAPWGVRLVVPSRFGRRLAYGLHSEGARHLIVSGGLGYTGPPLRIGVPPEWVLATLSSA